MPVEVVDETVEFPIALPEGSALERPLPEGIAPEGPLPEGIAPEGPLPKGSASVGPLPEGIASEGPLPEGAAMAEPLLAAAAEKAATAVLACLDRSDDELCVMLVDDERMRELNRDWRGKDSTTDVLSFSQLEGEEMHSGAVLLGDVVVSVDVLRRQAAEGGWTVEEELARLLLHGVLHLLGFDHEHEDDARAMRAEEGRLVALLAERGVACAWEGE